MKKDFDTWTTQKKDLHITTRDIIFKEREIWWCSIGVNLGHEEDGKGTKYNRPVLIVRKFNKRLFWGVPLTTQVKNSSHYHKFTLNNKDQCAMLTQLRLWDVTRLDNKMGQLGRNEFQAIRNDLISYLQ